MAAVRIFVSSVLMLGIFILADIHPVPAAEKQEKGPRVRVETSRLLVRDTVVLGSDRGIVYPLESGPSGFSSLRVNALGFAGVSVKLLDSRNYSLYQAGSSFDAMPARSENIRNMRFFFFDVPEAGKYYLIVGMEKKGKARKVTIFASGIYERMPREKSRILGLYQVFYELMRESFVFPDFSITVGGCGEENAFSVPDIFICDEFLAGLPEEGHEYLALWVASHELGHNLLNAWGSKLWNNEESADELGSVILSVTPYRQRVVEALARLLDERTSLSGRLVSNKRWRLLLNRARKTGGWLAAPEDLRARWADFLMPHLRGQRPSGLRGCYPEPDDELSPCTFGAMSAKAATQCFQYIPDPLATGE